MQEVGGKLHRGRIVLIHRDGILTIPAGLNLPVEDLYAELLQRTESGGLSRRAFQTCRSHVAKEIETFGEDHVWTFKGTKETCRIITETGRQLNCFVLLGLAALVWCLAPFIFFNHVKSPESFAWLGFGVAWPSSA